MRRRPAAAVTAGLLAGAWAVVVLLGAGCGQEQAPPATGEAAPAVSLQTLDGEPIGFPGSHRGAVTAVRFWADWCPYCEEEMRAIEPVYQALRDRGLRVLAVNVGQDAATARRFTWRLGIGYEVALDVDAEAARRFGVLALPTTYLVDREGRVRRRILGEAPVATFRAAVEALLAEEPPTFGPPAGPAPGPAPGG